MPNTNRRQTAYVVTGNPDTVNETPQYSPGELGMAYDYNDRAYQIVQCDSGATSATGTGAVAANELAFWKDRSRYLVTNDARFSDLGATNFRNSVAGVFRNAATAGNIVHILQRGRAIPVKSDGNGVLGDIIIANSGTSADATRITAGSAITWQVLGVAAAATSGGNISTDLDIPNIP